MTLNEMIAQALAEQPMSDYEKNDLATRLLEILSHLYMLVGHNLPQPYDLSVIANKLAINLKRDYATLTLGEVRICLELGVEGQYGEFRVLSITAYSAWLKQYKISDLRYRAVLKRHRDLQLQALPPITKAYNQSAEDRMLLRSYANYCADYPLDRMLPGRLYRILQQRGLINDTPAEKREAMKLFAHWKPETSLPMNEETLLHFRKNRAMEMLLQRYFDKLRDEGVRELPLYPENKPEQPV